MKITKPGNFVSRDGQRGSAALIVLIFLVIIISLAVGNNIALNHLKREMRLIEARQLQRYGPTTVTNQSAIAKPVPQPPGQLKR